MNESEKNNMLRAVLDALPALVFVVDQDVRIQEYNTAASEIFEAQKKDAINQRAGEILHCVHSREVPEGCGRAMACKNCIIRNSVTEAFMGKRVVRRRSRVELFRDSKKIEIFALITASPFCYQERLQVLLVVEDISEIGDLHRLIPICCVCKKVQDDKESWMKVESYFKNSWLVDFTHGYCPECFKVEMAKVEAGR